MTQAIVAGRDPAQGRTATLVYILYLVGLIIQVTHLIGVIVAYIYRNDGPDWVRTHYRFQIRTFWIVGRFRLVPIRDFAFNRNTLGSVLLVA